MTIDTENDQLLTTNARFIRNVNCSTVPNPVNKRERLFDHSVLFELTVLGGLVWIQGMRSLYPGNGNASRALDCLCRLADVHQIQLCLSPAPFGPRGKSLGVRALREWYGRRGFVQHEGRQHYVRVPRA